MDNKIQFLTIKNSRWISAWKKQFCSSKMMAAANIRKARGSSVGELMQFLLASSFCGVNIWQRSGKQVQGPCRDAFYRFLGDLSHNWRRLLLAVSLRIIQEFDQLTGPRTDRVLIMDESPWPRGRSRKVELLGHQYDSSNDRYYRGFRMLTLGWSDGHSFIPQQLELLTNREAKKRIGPDPDLDGRTHGGKRSKVATQKTTDLAVEMVKRSLGEATPADYLVFDSWFALPPLLGKIVEYIPVVCRLKNHPKFFYRYAGKLYNLERLYWKVRGRKRSNPEGPIVGSITVQMHRGPTLRVVFLVDQDNPDAWIALGSTDTQITPGRVCQIYGKRWAIEVFFKQTKQHLGLASELQVRSYTSCVAHSTIVFLRYMILAYYKRQHNDERTIPGLFYAACQGLQALQLTECLQLIFLEWLNQIHIKNPHPFEAACQLCGIAEQFIANIFDNSIVFKPLISNCES